jgi:hypothetical protein
MVYKPKTLPDARRTTDTFRLECTRLGLPEPYLVGIDAHCSGTDMRSLGFDSTEHHEPQLAVLGPDAFQDVPLRSKLKRNLKKGILSSTLKIYSYKESIDKMVWIRPTFPHFPCCFVGWDNTARRDRHSIVMLDSTPEAFHGVLLHIAREVLHKAREDRIIFINAWNEWAEGMYLEPDMRFGRGYLEAVRAVLEKVWDQQTSQPLR